MWMYSVEGRVINEGDEGPSERNTGAIVLPLTL